MSTSENRLVHLDLKGAPLKLDYLEKLLPVLAEWGATGLLVEWEDTFPYSGRLASIGSLSSPGRPYTVEDVRKMYDLAADNNLTVIPLVQTFGHLEFVLKCAEWKKLREVDQYPASLCPAHPLSLPLVTEMLDQVIALSPSARHIHIGADEVWHLGLCSQCASSPKPRVFLTHVVAVLSHLRDKHPHIKPIMWDDMLRTIDRSTLDEFKLSDLVEPMVWHYQPSNFTLPQDIWDKYSQVFKRVWLASAFKGATGSCQLIPITLHHVSNHQQWLDTLDKISGMFQQVCGIALTGWSRYDHYATLCELLPPALPSLALCLRVWTSRRFDHQLLTSVSKELGYIDAPIPLNPYPRPQVICQELLFPGWRLATAVEWLANLRTKHTYVMDSDQVQTWLNPWQVENNFTNPMQIVSLQSAMAELDQEWESLERFLREQLPEVYYERTASEWLGSLVTPKRKQVLEMSEKVAAQLQLSSS